jgi:hypothetical protein
MGVTPADCHYLETRQSNAKLLSLGYEFKYPTIKEAMPALVAEYLFHYYFG